jgi:hypothetical protein
MTTDRMLGRSRRPYPPVAPAVLLAVLATLLLVGAGAPRSFGHSLPSVHVSTAGAGHAGVALWSPHAQQPDRAGWNDLPAAVLAAGVLVAAGGTVLARRRGSRAAVVPAFASSSPRAPPARVSTS